MSRQIAVALAGCLILSSMAGVAIAQTSPPPDPDQNQAQAGKLGTIVVTGSAIPRVDTETPSPVTIISAVEIKRSGLTTVADVVRSISADNSGTIPTAFTAGFAAGSSGVALRGLTVNSTLVLIDGLRQASYALADDGQRSFVDLNTIPLEAVDRIEVLKDGASSIYGADAIAGVVNIILKHDYQGESASVEIGDSQRGGGFMKRVTGSLGGGNLETDHYNAYVSFEYEGDNRIAVGQRGFPFNTGDLSSIGGNNAIGGQPGANSGSIYGSVAPGTLAPGANPITGVAPTGGPIQPLRPCGSGSNQVIDPNNNLGAGAGTYCTQNFALYGDDQPLQQRVGLYGRFTVKLNDYTEAYLDASYYQNEVTVDGVPPQIQTGTPNNTNNIALPPTLPNGALNPNNPFAAQGQYALINYAFGDIVGSSDLKNHVIRVVSGIKGTLGEWNYDADFNLNHTWLNSANLGFLDYTQLISDINSGAYNFIDPSQNSAAVRAALAPALTKTSTTDMDSLDLKANRSLADLAGGSLGLALGAQLRHEAQDDPDLNPSLAAQGLGIAHTIGSRNIGAVFGELDAPLLQSLDVDVSARYDHYSDFGSAFDPKIGLKWKPIDEVALRGTYSQGFRAPAFAENGSSAAEGFTTETLPQSFIDAHNGNAYTLPYGIGFLTQGNPNIKPEKSKSLTLGGIFQPTQSLSATVDYYAIKKTNVITAGPLSGEALTDYLSGQPVPAGYTIIPDLPDPAFPNALPRPLVVTSTYINANALRTDGVDLDLRGKFDLSLNSQFISDLTVTKIFSWKLINPDGTSNQFVGTQGPYGLSSGAGTPRYRANWANTVIWGPTEATATIYYTSGLYMSAPDQTNDNSCFSTAGSGNFPANCRSPSFTEIDLTGIWHCNDHIDFSAGVLNLFDRKPPFDPIDYAAINYNPTYAQAGIVGRFFKVGVHVRF
jgi:iron complex outermembrane receptor protein